MLYKKLLVLGFFLSCLFSSNGAEKVSSPPNLVVILADDLGYGDLGCTGSLQIKTPHVDRLAEQGVMCSRAYVAAPMCAPSRMALLTGRFPKRFGITTNPNVRVDYLAESHYSLPMEEKCLPQYLKEFGYKCGIVGKWHLGHTTGFEPTDRGFDSWWGFLGGSRPYFSVKKEQDGLNPSRIVSNYTDKPELSYLTDDIARECVRFIHEQKENPFFLYASFNAPHTPLQAKKEDLALFEEVVPDDRRRYCAMVYALDRAVGEILQALDETGRSRDTIVVFLSDNGGAHGAPSCNAPLRGGKRLHLEGGVRVPMIVRYPADKRLSPGSSCDHVVSAVDLLPALLTANGKAVPENLDGRDLLSLLDQKSKNVPRTFYWCTDYTSAVLDGDMKYVLIPDRAPQLYDLSKDVQELNDLYPQNIQKAAPMAKKLGQYLTSTPASRFPDSISWCANILKQYDGAKPEKQPKSGKVSD